MYFKLNDEASSLPVELCKKRNHKNKYFSDFIRLFARKGGLYFKLNLIAMEFFFLIYLSFNTKGCSSFYLLSPHTNYSKWINNDEKFKFWPLRKQFRLHSGMKFKELAWVVCMKTIDTALMSNKAIAPRQKDTQMFDFLPWQNALSPVVESYWDGNFKERTRRSHGKQLSQNFTQFGELVAIYAAILKMIE